MATTKERVWIEEYLDCWNATEAARRAGYKHPNKLGPRKLVKFKDEIAARVEELVMSADEALVRMSEIARGVWGQYVDGNGNVDIDGIVADGKAHLIHSVTYTKAGTPVYKFYDAQGALRDIAKIHGAFVERHEISGGVQLVGIDPDAEAGD
jgi:phage terminase small subunit